MMYGATLRRWTDGGRILLLTLEKKQLQIYKLCFAMICAWKHYLVHSRYLVIKR